MLVGSPFVWLLLLFNPPSRQQRAAGKRNRFQQENKSTKLEGEATCVYCAILLRRAAGAEWLLLVFIGAYYHVNGG